MIPSYRVVVALLFCTVLATSAFAQPPLPPPSTPPGIVTGVVLNEDNQPLPGGAFPYTWMGLYKLEPGLPFVAGSNCYDYSDIQGCVDQSGTFAFLHTWEGDLIPDGSYMLFISAAGYLGNWRVVHTGKVEFITLKKLPVVFDSSRSGCQFVGRRFACQFQVTQVYNPPGLSGRPIKVFPLIMGAPATADWTEFGLPEQTVQFGEDGGVIRFDVKVPADSPKFAYWCAVVRIGVDEHHPFDRASYCVTKP